MPCGPIALLAVGGRERREAAQDAVLRQPFQPREIFVTAPVAPVHAKPSALLKHDRDVA